MVNRESQHTATARSTSDRREPMFSDDYQAQSYWNESTQTPPTLSNKLPAHVDVAVIGSGYTGLHTALQTARGGRATLVLEAGKLGQGCSTRNGGQISTSIKPSVEELARKFGVDKAKAIREEGEIALQWIEDFIRSESIDCQFERNGRYHAAHTPTHFTSIARQAEKLNKKDGVGAFAVSRQEQRSELGTDVYHGGVVFPRHASLHAGQYHHQLLQRTLAAGATVVPECPAESINQIASDGDKQFRVKTSLGEFTARNVMLATNGYTTNLTPWFKRRIIPIGSYVIATERVSESVIDELFPTHRVVSDTCRVVYYYRASPDRQRVLFGGRVSANETNPNISGPRLHQQMCRIFPQLQKTKISHSWAGTVAYTFDELAHTGVHEGMHYAMGFCGSGVSMASYLGMRAGLKILDNPAGTTALDDLPFPSRPLYKGKPWFLPPVVSWYQWRDKQECKNAAR